MAQPGPDDDPRPEPPPRPDENACCGQGCNPCIFDLYEMARERYATKLRAWEERRAGRGGGSK
jgi:Oxidoreductase-like protein, N-terminal